ncbi:hypothetical protein U1298_02795 [Enterococcus cecorum]|uniref:hypothetical protein n=1 Tax=Enterococcus cecorum TaxID=44008 RepID=UPI002ACAACA6|nr:hypothetical protein [Enterococcus cecorum]MDZ5572761.1 hypothetical protein [Enterococcus cecorum]
MQKIMIIEDEAALAQELALLLTQAGYQAYVAKILLILYLKSKVNSQIYYY